MTRRILLAAAMCVPVAAVPVLSQTRQAPERPQVTYSADVTLVEVDAVVTDEQGVAVRDLRKEDFEILENGTPQAIDRISFVEIPVERSSLRAPAPASAPADARSNRPSDVRNNLQRFDGRLYVLLLDDVQTSAPRAERVRRAAQRFVKENLEPGDLASVVHVSGLGAPNQDFTSEPRLLLASIDRFQGMKLRSATLNRIEEYNRAMTASPLGAFVPPPDPEKMKDPDDAVRAFDARQTFEAIASIGRRLGPVRGRRKALLWFGEGVGYDMFDLSKNQAPAVLESARAAVAAATRANLVIYGMDARGLAGLGEETIQLSGGSSNPQANLGASGLQQELRRTQEHLRRVSNETGGFAALNTDEFERAFDRVVTENSAYYLLGYYPTLAAGDASYRRIDVNVKRPGVNVRARAGYVPAGKASASAGRDESDRSRAPRGAPAALHDALISPVPQSALRMATHAAAFKGKGDKASVLVTVEYGAAAFETPAPSGDRLQTSVIAVDPLGKIEASDHVSIGLDVQAQTRQAMKVLGFRTHSRVELPQGRYQLRVAGTLANGLVGSVHHDIEVPDFAASEPALSDLVLTSIVAGLVPTAQMDARMKQVLPAPPSATRDFRQDEAIALFAEIYDAGRVPSRDVAFTTTVRSADGAIVFNRSEPRTVDRLKESNGGYWLQVPLRALAPGDYSLRLEAVVVGAKAPVAREAGFHVWTPADSQPAGRDPKAALPFVVVTRAAVSGVTEPRQVIARSADELQALWGSLSLRTPAPQVAFSNTMIAALFLGSRPTAGYEPEVVGVRRDAETLVIEWRERRPDAGNPPADTTPFAIVGIPMHAGAVRFEQVP